MRPSSHLIDQLTPRQRQVLALVARAKSNREIAKQLVIAVSTVENHLHIIFQKLDVKTRTEAALVAFQSGLVSGGDRGIPS